MNVQITHQTATEDYVSFEMASEKKSAYIGYSHRTGRVDVCCLNASNRVWRGLGRNFASFAEARAAYKSGEMKAMIELAEALKS